MNKAKVILGGKEFTARIELAFYERLNISEGLSPEQIFKLPAYKRLYHGIACQADLMGETFMTFVDFILTYGTKAEGGALNPTFNVKLSSFYLR